GGVAAPALTPAPPQRQRRCPRPRDGRTLLPHRVGGTAADHADLVCGGEEMIAPDGSSSRSLLTMSIIMIKYRGLDRGASVPIKMFEGEWDGVADCVRR